MLLYAKATNYFVLYGTLCVPFLLYRIRVSKGGFKFFDTLIL